MTNEEAIQALNAMILLFKRYSLYSEHNWLTKAAEVAIEALKSKWIPVSDRVPEDDRLVIVCTESGQVYTDYYFDDQPDFWRLAKIIAWQDLPRAYKKEDSDGKLQ